MRVWFRSSASAAAWACRRIASTRERNARCASTPFSSKSRLIPSSFRRNSARSRARSGLAVGSAAISFEPSISSSSARAAARAFARSVSDVSPSSAARSLSFRIASAFAAAAVTAAISRRTACSRSSRSSISRSKRIRASSSRRSSGDALAAFIRSSIASWTFPFCRSSEASDVSGLRRLWMSTRFSRSARSRVVSAVSNFARASAAAFAAAAIFSCDAASFFAVSSVDFRR
ncbi:MAG: hypothetical protein HMLKMBBP_01921 [Planctomycetes bacterium]|nr:hypothetical protein [Planctomycetota bacterium]